MRPPKRPRSESDARSHDASSSSQQPYVSHNDSTSRGGRIGFNLRGGRFRGDSTTGGSRGNRGGGYRGGRGRY
jgi:hypothetical protein